MSTFTIKAFIKTPITDAFTYKKLEFDVIDAESLSKLNNIKSTAIIDYDIYKKVYVSVNNLSRKLDNILHANRDPITWGQQLILNIKPVKYSFRNKEDTNISGIRFDLVLLRAPN